MCYEINKTQKSLVVFLNLKEIENKKYGIKNKKEKISTKKLYAYKYI